MNKYGNIRSQATKEKIQRALMYLLKRKTFSEIYVKDICTIACINRSSFYEHYQDINDLMIKTETNLSKSMGEIFKDAPYFKNENFVKMFEFIKNNADFYKAYLTNHEGSFMAETDFLNYKKKLEKHESVRKEYKDSEIIYHMAFFSAGLNAICKVWLNSGMKETPQEMAEIISKEYSKKTKFFS